MIAILCVVAYILIGAVTYWLYENRTCMASEDFIDVFTNIWLGIVWPCSLLCLPFAIVDWKNKKQN